MIVQKNPAIVVSPAPKLLWLQAYPHGYHPNQYAAEAMPHKAHPFKIPKAWFVTLAAAQKQTEQQPSVVRPATHQNPWRCQPAHLPCGKANTDYWACNKTAKAALQNVVHHCQTNHKKSWDSITAQGGAR